MPRNLPCACRQKQRAAGVYTMGHTLVIEEAEKITCKAGARDGAEQRTQNHSPSGAAEGVGSWRSERPAAGWKCIDCTCVGEWKT